MGKASILARDVGTTIKEKQLLIIRYVSAVGITESPAYQSETRTVWYFAIMLMASILKKSDRF